MTSSGAPVVSIITPCYNRADFLTAAVESVLTQFDEQHNDRYEHIVVDGGSTDGTLAMLAAYPHLRVVSEPDQGMYDAINKGIRLARGEWIGLLNSDDRYAPGALSRLRKTAAAHPTARVILGDALIDSKEVIRNDRSGRFTFASMAAGFQINACFFHRSLFEQIGAFDPSYRIVGDVDFLLRLALAAPVTAHTGTTLYHIVSHPGSLTFSREMRGLERRLAEEIPLWRRWLGRTDLPGEGRRYCEQRLGHACFTLLAWHAANGRLGQAARVAWIGWRDAPATTAARWREWLTAKRKQWMNGLP
jgi:glycosyltransferase involved in cell wall biosynthesis